MVPALMQSLITLPDNTLSKVLEIRGSQSLLERLFDYGVKPGCLVTIKNRMPFSGPLILQTGNTSFSLRFEEAKCLQVQILP